MQGDSIRQCAAAHDRPIFYWLEYAPSTTVTGREYGDGALIKVDAGKVWHSVDTILNSQPSADFRAGVVIARRMSAGVSVDRPASPGLCRLSRRSSFPRPRTYLPAGKVGEAYCFNAALSRRLQQVRGERLEVRGERLE